MKTTTITLEVTPDELFDIAYALEHYIIACVEYPHIRTVAQLRDEECPAEIKMLEHFVYNHSYSLTLCSLDFTSFDDVDDWLVALMDEEMAKREAKEKSEAAITSITKVGATGMILQGNGAVSKTVSTPNFGLAGLATSFSTTDTSSNIAENTPVV